MFIGPPIDDRDILMQLPPDLKRLLQQANGYVAYRSGLHIRGACLDPAWHALRSAWSGVHALHQLFPSINATDIPFAEDALGDQYLLRDGIVHRLNAETGDVASLDFDLAAFDVAVRADADEVLGLGPLRDWQAEGHELRPGELLEVHPPLLVAFDGVRRVRAAPALERRRNLAAIAAGIRNLPDGTVVSFDTDPRER